MLSDEDDNDNEYDVDVDDDDEYDSNDDTPMNDTTTTTATTTAPSSSLSSSTAATTTTTTNPATAASASKQPIRKAKSAFLFYQTEMLSKIRAELSNSNSTDKDNTTSTAATASMGEAMTELSNRWRNLSATERQPYLDMHTADVERYEAESYAADMAALAEVEKKRNEAATTIMEVGTTRNARSQIEQERQIREEKRQKRLKAMAEDNSDQARMRREIAAQKKAEVQERREKREEEQKLLAKQHKKLDKEEAKKAAARLDYLLKQSSIFAKLQGGKGSLPTGNEKDDTTTTTAPSKKDIDKKKKGSVHHRTATNSGNDDDDELEDDEDDDTVRHVFLTKQPSSIKFGQLKPYQLESLNWMIHLAEKGLNGILADEMGLGKTLQSISILAYHWEYLRIQGPHLICVPKSTLSNWMNELNRWCPSLRAIKFHGSREEREYMIENDFNNEAAAHDGRRPDKQIMNEKGELIDDNTNNPRSWDVCVTTYEVANTERRVLQKFAWCYLVIDEAHRLKNDASMFSKTVRSFKTSNRLLLTGTPLQNNLHELWALLNFLLPDIFSSADQFDDWFDLEIEDEEAKKNIISQLHNILRPFMLRRLKADVAKGLPPKTETILMVGMSAMQKKLYKQLLLRDLDSITGKASGKNRTAILNIVMQLRKCYGHPYLFEGVEDRTLDPLGEHLVENCGKLSMVDKLLKRLKELGSRVLIFTQMTKVLDILEDYMVMRGYEYCRIDGNTTYEDRESQIAEFNSDGSSKFVFLLSTRAGGLGINLQTADVCVLYDSDWNPQADLQAQDRCHRLGQKKPVSVFRLVSENTIEEKIVERAQQKLKLDAMVVQQGRLKDADKVSKEEIMAAVRFGADTVFRSEESTITDDDIDVILERGKAKTKELQEKITKAEKGDLLDFKLDGGISAQTFEGIDYSDKNLREHLRMLAASSIGKRERRPPPMNYNPIIVSKKSMVVNNQRIKLPKPLRIPQMEDHHFYNRERLLELGKLEFENYAALRESGQVPPREVMEKHRSLLPPELAQEKRELLAEGFGHWSRSQYYNFIKACAKHGRDDIAAIANDMDMPQEEVGPYGEAFWNYGPTELKNEWERVVGNIERGEKKLAKQKKLSALLTKFVSTFDNPRFDMVFANKGTAHFALEQDRALLCAVEKHGYGNWESVREEIRTDSRLKFQIPAQGMTVQAIAKRIDYRMRQMEKELEAREKVLKSKRPPTLLAAQKTMEAIKEMDQWDAEAREALLQGKEPPSLNKLSLEARTEMKERLKERDSMAYRLREIEVQVQRALLIADETRNSIYDCAQYVNYSNITLKAATPATGPEKSGPGLSIQEGIQLEAAINPKILAIPPCLQCSACMESNTTLCAKRLEVRKRLIAEATKSKDTSSNTTNKKKVKKRKAENPVVSAPVPPLPPVRPIISPGPPKKKFKATVPAPAKDGNAPTKPRVTSQGNKRMDIPDDLFPEFCRRISAYGTGERMKLINKFVDDYPSISVRQVTMRFSEITTRERPGCIPTVKIVKKTGRAFMFYLRPCFYKHLPASERPVNWEEYAYEDEKLYEEEKELRRINPSIPRDDGEPRGHMGGDDGDETEDDNES